MLEMIDIGIENAIAYRIEGKVTEEEMIAILAIFKEKIDKGERLNVYQEVVSIGGVELDAMIEKFKFFREVGFSHFDRIAVVTHTKWLHKIVDLEGKIFKSIHMKGFSIDEKDQAVEFFEEYIANINLSLWELTMERIQIVNTDITKLKVDAIVNAANNSLLGGGGVDGAIHRAAGPELVNECRTLNGCPTGDAKITGGYNLPAKFVIHTVGPIWKGGGNNERSLLASCYKKSLQCGVDNGVKTIAFPAISCGAYGFPIAEACDIAIHEVCGYLDEMDAIITVYFACFSPEIEKELRRAKAEREASS